MPLICSDDNELFRFIEKWEKAVEYIYLDSRGLPTVGIGHLLWNRKAERSRYDDVLAVHHKYGFRLRETDARANDREVKDAFDQVVEKGSSRAWTRKHFTEIATRSLVSPQLIARGIASLTTRSFTSTRLQLQPPILVEAEESVRKMYSRFAAGHYLSDSRVLLPTPAIVNLKRDDAERIIEALAKGSWPGHAMRSMPQCGQIALIDLAFNVGYDGVQRYAGTYRLLREAVKNSDWSAAARHIEQIPPSARLDRRRARARLLEQASQETAITRRAP
jgi:GH24 family phage-related lysozyme (muramidase)